MSALGAMEASNAYLETYLEPLQPILARPEVTDIFVNRPAEVWTETLGGAFERHVIPALDRTNLWRLARQIAAHAHQGVTREHPLLSATLPDGSRAQVIAPPATRGDLALAIRKHVMADMTLQDMGARRMFDAVNLAGDAGARGRAGLAQLLAAGKIAELLRQAVGARQNIVVCGGTSTGKTTFANALIKEIPAHERLIFIEDAPELQILHPNALGLLAVRGELGEARVTTNDLIEASLRMRPDRIILGELRGKEAFSFIRAANTGHPGSITTVHADDPAGALNQLTLMILQSGANLGRSECEHYVRQVVDVWVQLERGAGGRVVSQIVLGAARGALE